MTTCIWFWLVVSTPLKNMSQLGWWHSQLNGKIKAMFQTTNQISMVEQAIFEPPGWWWLVMSELIIKKGPPVSTIETPNLSKSRLTKNPIGLISLISFPIGWNPKSESLPFFAVPRFFVWCKSHLHGLRWRWGSKNSWGMAPFFGASKFDG